jgi:hypothetical protein
MPNTISTKTYRDKWRLAALDKLLRNNLVAEAISEVDRSDKKIIHSPYGSQPTVTVQALTGTYNIDTFTTTDDDLEVNREFIVAEHVFDFEDTLSNFDLFASRTDEQMYAVAAAIDKHVLNTLVANAGQSYVAPTVGFSTPANLPIIISELWAIVAGYADVYKGVYLILEAGDLVGILQKQVDSGFSFADAALRNGFVTTYMGVDLHVVRPSTFATYNNGVDNFTNQGKRLFGVKKTTTYAHPRGVKFEEKSVSGKTGMEIVTYGYIGAKVWFPKKNLTVAVTNAGSSPSSSVSPSISKSVSPSVSPT